MTQTTVLTGDELANWLETQEAFLFENPQGLERDDLKRILSNTLAETPCQPDDPRSVYRYHRLWAGSGNLEKSLEILNQFAPQVVDQLSQQEREHFLIHVSLWKTYIYFDLDRDALIAELENLVQALLAYTGDQGGADMIDVWEKTLETCEYAKLWDLYRQYTRHRIAAEPQYVEGGESYVLGQLWLLRQDARTFALEENHEAMHRAATNIIALLKNPNYADQFGMHDWLKEAENLVFYTPNLIDEMLPSIRGFIQSDWHQAKVRDLETRILRLQAKQHAAKGEFQQAVDVGLSAHFFLSGDKNDGFTAYLIDWLIEVGDFDRAGELAFTAERAARPYTANYSFQKATELKERSPSIYWHLIIAWRNLMIWLKEDYVYYEEQQAPELTEAEREAARQIYLSERALAEAINPEHYAFITMDLDILMHQCQTIYDDEVAKQVLEMAERYWQILNSPKTQAWVKRYLEAKAQINGIESVLTGDILPCDGANWNYGVSCSLFSSEQEEEMFSEYTDKIKDFRAKYEEITMQQLEHFIATGKGHYLSGDIHDYSMMLNNHAIYYICRPKEADTTNQDYLYAIELNRRGLAISPFAEHYNNILIANLEMENEEGILQTAEDLWHYASQYGYSRHTPQIYVRKLTSILAAQDRIQEIQIWLDRMDLWFSWLPAEEQRDQEENYCFSAIYLLGKIASFKPDEALIRLEKDKPIWQKYLQNDAGLPINVGMVYQRVGNIPEAIQYYEQAIQIAIESDYQSAAELAQSNIDALKESNNASQPSKPWWKFW